MRVIAIFIGLQASALGMGGNKMRHSHNTKIYVTTLCLSVLMATSAFADDCSSPTGYISNPSCPPGSVAYQAAELQPGTLAYQMKQQQECSNPNGYMSNFSCPMGSAAYQQKQRVAAEAAAAADPRNRNDPNSPYYAGTPAQQCEAAKHSFFCSLGIACPPPPGIDCAQVGATRAAARHHHPY